MKDTLALVISFFLFPAVTAITAHAGIEITTVQRSYKNPDLAYTSVTLIRKEGIRIETGENGETSIIIYRNDRKVLWIITPHDRTYTEVTRSDIQRIKNGQDGTSSGWKGQQGDIVYEKTDSAARVRRWICKKYFGFLGGKKKEAIWTTDWKSLGLNREHFAVLQGLSVYTSELTKGVASFFRAGSEKWEQHQGYAGIPVRTVSYKDGTAEKRTEIRDVRKKDFSLSLIDVPRGFMKKNVGSRGLP